MNKIKLLIILIFSFIGINSYSQYIPPTPEAEVFQRFGDYMMNTSTGIPDISLPIYTIKHKGYEIPLNLSYNNQGAKPGYNYDVFGFGWNLSGRGKVVRSRNNIPDEFSDFVVHSIYDYCLNGGCEGDPSVVLEAISLSTSEGNFAPDRFNVTLPNGKNFDFYIERLGSKLFFQNSLGVNVSIAPTYNTSSGISGFTVTDVDGVKYSFFQPVKIEDNSFPKDYYSEWDLTRIDLPNSSIPIIYSYNINYKNLRVNYAPSVENTVRFVGGEKESLDCPVSERKREQPIIDKGTKTWNVAIHNVLGNISYGNNLITFNYDFEERSSTIGTNNFAWINSIEINLGTQKKIVAFNTSEYTKSTNFFPLKKLDNLTFSNTTETESKVYGFEYEDLTCYTDATNTDHWGNVIINTSYTGLPNFEIDLFYVNYFLSYSSWSFVKFNPHSNSWTTCRLGTGSRETQGGHGILKKITYPTGGYSKFHFENHAYYSDWFQEKRYAAGFRIESIKNYSSDNNQISANIYRYDQDNLKDGHLYDNYGLAFVEPSPINYLTLKEEYIDNRDFHPLKVDKYTSYYRNVDFIEYSFNANTFRKHLNGRPNVVYPKVTIVHEGKLNKALGKTELYFDFSRELSAEQNNENLPFWEFLSMGGAYPCSESESGAYNKLIKKVEWGYKNSAYFKVNEENNAWVDLIGVNFYDIDFEVSASNDRISYTECLEGNPDNGHYFYAWVSEKEGCNDYSYRAQIDSTINTTYFENGETAEQKVKYLYDQNNNKTSEESFTSKEKINFIEYLRPQDLNTVTSQLLIEKNMYSSILETKKTVINSSTNEEIVTHASKTDYELVSYKDKGYVLPSIQYSMEGVETDGSIKYKEDSQIHYNTDAGRYDIVPESVSSYNSPNVYYIWGYNDQYPVAKIENATYDQVKTAFGGTIPDLGLTGLSSNQEQQLRNNLPDDVFVSTFNYNPLYGMTSQTDPNGRIITYEYDGLGRLVTIKDQDGNILKKYDYHYVTE